MSPVSSRPHGISLCLLAATLLVGCVHAPSAPPQTTVALAQENTLPAQSISGAPWWRLYREPSLDALVAEALANNRDLRAAVARLLQARTSLDAMRARRGPSTDLSAGAGYGSTLQDQIAAAADGGDAIRTGPRFDGGVEVSWEVDLFGRLRSGEAVARADVAASSADVDAMRVLVAAGVTDAWLRACGLGVQVAVARDAMALAEQGRDLAAKRAAAGATPPSEVLRAEASVADVAAGIPMLEAERRDALAEIAVLTGRPPLQGSTDASACTRLPAIDAPIPVPDALSLLRRRPDLRAAEQRLAAATARIGIAVGDLYPHVSLGGGFGLSSPSVSGMSSRENAVWRLGPLLSWSFPNIGIARARLAGARSGEAAALAAFDGAILRALAEVNRSADGYRAAQQRQAQKRLAEQRSRQASGMMRARHDAGVATAAEALEAAQAHVDARRALAQADSDLAAAQVRLFKALGGGWEDAPAIILPVPVRPAAGPLKSPIAK